MIFAKWVQGLEGAQDAISLRKEVFCGEQGFDPDLEVDERDATAWHAMVYRDGRCVAAGRAFPEGAGVWRIGRIVSHRDCRGQHMGDLVMRMAMRKAVDEGAIELVLLSQLPAMGFYARFGFMPEGEQVLDEGCPHQPMRVRADRIDWNKACQRG